MTQVTGDSILELIEGGWSGDGRDVWISYKLIDGSIKTAIWPMELVGFLIESLQNLAVKAHAARVTSNPVEATDGVFSSVVSVKELRIGSTSEMPDQVIFQCLTEHSVPIALGIPNDIAKQLQMGLSDALSAIETARRDGQPGQRQN